MKRRRRATNAVAAHSLGTADPTTAPRRMAVLARVAAGVAALIAGCVLIGWVFDVEQMRQLFLALSVMKANSALCLLLLAAASFVPRRLAAVLAAAVAVLVVLTLIEHAANVRLGIDQMLANDPSLSGIPGRMSVVTAVTLGVLAGAELCLAARQRRAAQALATAALVVASLTLLGYAYDVPWLHSVQPVAIALSTTVGLLLTSIATLAAVPDGALAWTIYSRQPGAALVRRMLPVALIGLPVVGLLALVGQRSGSYRIGTTVAITVVVCALLVGVSSWTAAMSVTRVDRTRDRALAELTALRLDLEEQVEERAQQLQSRGNEIALLEDRQRIAADLHDIVVQRLFAAGMFLQSSTALARDPDSRERVDSVVEALDMAIKDLRASIFELGGRLPLHNDLTSAIDDVAEESARVLGFRPDLVVDDPDGDADAAREDILAVVREGLANVARHARASAASVELRSQDGIVVLTIADNGRGLTKFALRSGTRNMAERARGRGGECLWVPIEPHGTRVEWRVPVAVRTGA